MDEIQQKYNQINSAIEKLANKIYSDEIIVIARTDDGVLLASNCESVESILQLFDAANEQMDRNIHVNPN